MHDDLIAVARRRARVLIVLMAGSAAAGPTVLVAILAGVLAGAVVFVLGAALTAAWLLTGARGLRVQARPQGAVRPADPEVANVNEAIASAYGLPPAEALQVADDAPNVAAWVHRGRRTVIVTDGAVGYLSRDQLEAVCAAQLAVADDPTCRRLEGVGNAVRVGRVALVAEPLVVGMVMGLQFWVGLAAPAPESAAGHGPSRWAPAGLRASRSVAGRSISARARRFTTPACSCEPRSSAACASSPRRRRSSPTTRCRTRFAGRGGPRREAWPSTSTGRPSASTA